MFSAPRRDDDLGRGICIQRRWSAARDTIRTLFLDPPPAVRSVFDQLVDEE
jgi:hypothetical protein